MMAADRSLKGIDKGTVTFITMGKLPFDVSGTMRAIFVRRKLIDGGYEALECR